MGNYQLRTPIAADIDAMWRVRTAAILAITAYPIESITRWANASRPPDFAKAFEAIEAVVCSDGDTILGWGFADLSIGKIEALYVDPDCQGRGIGRRMFEHFELRARAEGLRSLSLSSSLNAVPFYETVGFIQTGDTIFRHPSGVDLPSVLMNKALT